LQDDYGPWNDYEIVDSADKDAVVGIRKKGEEQIIFSASDLMKLPNYKQSTSATPIAAKEEAKE
jgi:hypothetical protein